MGREGCGGYGNWKQEGDKSNLEKDKSKRTFMHFISPYPLKARIDVQSTSGELGLTLALTPRPPFFTLLKPLQFEIHLPFLLRHHHTSTPIATIRTRLPSATPTMSPVLGGGRRALRMKESRQKEEPRVDSEVCRMSSVCLDLALEWGRRGEVKN